MNVKESVSFDHELSEFLQERFPGMDPLLQVLPSGRIYGVWLWDKFARKDDCEKIELVWPAIKERFKERASLVGSLFCFTTAERKELQAA
ncbi:hypothetical protein BH11ARM2_BH11ARM2_33540 [soil metagenome]